MATRRKRRRNLSGADEPPEDGTDDEETLDDAPQPAASSAARSTTNSAARSTTSGAATANTVNEENATSDEDTASTPPKRARGFRAVFVRLLKIAALLVLGSALLLTIALYLVLDHYSKDLPSVETLKRGYDPPQITRIYARDQTLLASVFTERRTVIPFEQIPDAAKLAFLAAEDARFYEHEGLNYFGIARAFAANVRAGHMVQGGSSITQQVIKNVLLDSERSLARKIREMLLVHRLEQSLSKDEIFWLYLNHIYLGHGRYGIEEATRFYFGKPARELKLEEAATLAGLIAAPERYSPRRDPKKSLTRRSYVLDQMLKKQFVTQQLFDSVSQAPLRLAPSEEAESRLAPEMIDHARTLLSELVPGQAASGGFAITTTIDPTLQAAARKAVRGAVDAYVERHDLLPPFTAASRKLWPLPYTGTPTAFRVYTGVVESADDQAGTLDVRVGNIVGRVSLAEEARYNPKRLSPSAFAKPKAVLRVRLVEEPGGPEKPALRLELGPQAALVALDARSRDVLALVGSYEGVSGGLDRATRAKRQPGSSFKPLLYSYALHTRRFTPATRFNVKQRGHGVPQEGPLSLSLRDAVAHSNNEAAQQLMRDVGPKGVVEWAQALGVESRLEPDLSLALGAYEVGVLELTNAYVTFANGGDAGVPRFIKSVLGASGQELPLPALPPARSVMTKDEAYLTTSVLRSVVTHGTGRTAQSLGREVAGKTGTTNDAKDAWFIGYSTDIVAGVWVGYDEPLPLGSGESGAKTALPAWTEFMKTAQASLPKMTFPRTPGVLVVKVDPRTGLLPAPGQTDTLNEEFLAGTEPSQIAPYDAGAPAASGTASPQDAGAPRAPELPPF